MNGLSLIEFLLGVLVILLSLRDAFETIILPRTVQRSFRLTRFFFKATQVIYTWIGKMRDCSFRRNLWVSFAPITLFCLIGFWACLLILGFALVGEGLHTPFKGGAPEDFINRLYFSGTTFFTLGFGDFVPDNFLGKTIAFLEAGTGFAFLALVIGYVPVFYSAFSKRERTILLLDSKAGSDPVASEIFRRYSEAGCLDELPSLLREWEQFSAQLLENFLSYPLLAFYRSQHDDQSWLNSLTAVTDACALAMCCYPGDDPVAKKIRFQANQTFVMSRHLIVDFAYVIGADPVKPKERLKETELRSMVGLISKYGLTLRTDDEALKSLAETRELYEPFATGLAKILQMDMPDWIRAEHVHDNWETTAWDGTHF